LQRSFASLQTFFLKMGDEGAPFAKECNSLLSVNKPIVRTFDEEMCFIKRLTPWNFEIKEGFVPGMNVKGYSNS
jgi:hypothetical protein